MKTMVRDAVLWGENGWLYHFIAFDERLLHFSYAPVVYWGC